MANPICGEAEALRRLDPYTIADAFYDECEEVA